MMTSTAGACGADDKLNNHPNDSINTIRTTVMMGRPGKTRLKYAAPLVGGVTRGGGDAPTWVDAGGTLLTPTHCALLNTYCVVVLRVIWRGGRIGRQTGPYRLAGVFAWFRPWTCLQCTFHADLPAKRRTIRAWLVGCATTPARPTRVHAPN